MKDYMNMKTIKTWTLLVAGLLLTASCANDDAVQQKDTNTDNGNDKNLTSFVTGAEPTSRTSMDYASGNFYWEEGDHIYVQDDDNVWQKSSNAPTAKTDHFKFMVPGKFKNHTSYKVYYPGKTGNKDQVTIPAAQTQTAPNTTAHFGVSGDCGIADATGTKGRGPFNFMLDHQAAILVFQPYTSNTILKNCYLTKVEVTSDNDIAATYTLDPTNGLTGTGTGKQIVLTTKSSTYGSANYNGFPLNTTSANVTTNGAYMLIKPGTHILKIRYWVKDVATNVEGTITKNLSSFNYAKNTYYDMAANLDVKDYDGDHYYMWDAKKQYWDGWEWTKNLPDGQPTLNTNSSNNYPQSNSDPRYYNNSYSGFGVRNDAQTTLFKTLPNVNEMVWYAQKGSPRKDGDELWTTMGHLHKGGIWFKKKASISGFDTNLAPDGYDWRVNGNGSGWSVSQTLPSASEANQFFYLPALGRYYFGQLDNVGDNGYFWSSSAYPFSQSNAFGLSFFGGNVYVDHYASRTYGYRAQTFK